MPGSAATSLRGPVAAGVKCVRLVQCVGGDRRIVMGTDRQPTSDNHGTMGAKLRSARRPAGVDGWSLKWSAAQPVRECATQVLGRCRQSRGTSAASAEFNSSSAVPGDA